MRCGTLAVVALGLVCTGALGGGDAAKKRQERLQGTWAVLKLVKAGQPAPADEVQKTRLVITGDKLTVKSDGKRDEVSRFTLDPSKKPATIDIRPEDGKDKSGSLPGIYKFEKGQLVLCFAQDGKARPTEFASTQETDTTLAVLERVKK